MNLVKLIHVSSAMFSLLGFIARGLLMMFDSPLMQARWIRVIPHLVDTTLLVSAIILVVQYGFSLANSAWLIAKLIALIIYIALGLVALRYGSTKQIRIIAWLAALIVFAYIVAVAITKSPILLPIIS